RSILENPPSGLLCWTARPVTSWRINLTSPSTTPPVTASPGGIPCCGPTFPSTIQFPGGLTIFPDSAGAVLHRYRPKNHRAGGSVRATGEPISVGDYDGTNQQGCQCDSHQPYRSGESQ